MGVFEPRKWGFGALSGNKRAFPKMVLVLFRVFHTYTPAIICQSGYDCATCSGKEVHLSPGDSPLQSDRHHDTSLYHAISSPMGRLDNLV